VTLPNWKSQKGAAVRKVQSTRRRVPRALWETGRRFLSAQIEGSARMAW